MEKEEAVPLQLWDTGVSLLVQGQRWNRAGSGVDTALANEKNCLVHFYFFFQKKTKSMLKPIIRNSFKLFGISFAKEDNSFI